MTVSKWFKRGGSLAAVAVLALTFASCGAINDLFGNNSSSTPDIEIAGTWVDAFNSGIVVTNSAVKFYYPASSGFTDATKWQECEIVSYGNDAFNSGESGSGNCGYMVLKYVSSYTASAVGKYGILRWQSLTTSSGVTTMSYSEGYLYPGVYSDTAAAAQTAFTTASGAFYYSAITKQ